MKELTEKEADQMMTSKVFFPKVAVEIKRAVGTTRHLVMAVTQPAGFRTAQGKHTHYWHTNQLKSIVQHFKENPPAGRGRPKKKKETA